MLDLDISTILLQTLVGFNIVIYLSRFRSNNDAYKLFALYLLVIGVNQYLSIIIGKGLHQSNLMLFHVYFIAQFIILTFFYVELLKQKWLYAVLGGVGIFLIYQYSNDPELIMRYNGIGVVITQGLLVIYALMYFYKFLRGEDEFIIVNIALFFYLLSSILIFASGNLIFNLDLITEEGYALLFDINTVLYFAFQILILVQWWKTYSPAKAKL